mgnify:CR=1 FL=1
MNPTRPASDHLPSDPSAAEALLTPRDVADMLRVSVRTLYRWIDHGHVTPPLRLGRSLRWRRDDIDRWLEDQARRN